MRVRLLGSAAGGGFPQWNCACPNCRSVRDRTFSGKPRTQLQVAISEDSESWFLLNASPDIRFQIEAEPLLHPRGLRHTPITGVVLTSADLDQVLGLLSLREFQHFRIFATSAIQQVLREDNSVFAVLNRVPDQVEWVEVSSSKSFSLQPDLRCTPLLLGHHLPSYVSEERQRGLFAEEMSLGLVIKGSSSHRLAYLPSVPEVGPDLLKQLEKVDVMLFDGTFWSDDELIRIRQDGTTARQIGHLPVSGPGGSLEALSQLKHTRKIYIHINNTNPMLDESGSEYRQVREAGWEIAEDGWECEL